MLVSCDANSTMGSVVSQHVSSHGSAPDNVNSFFLHLFSSSVACLSRLPFRSSIPVRVTPIPSFNVRKRVDYAAKPVSIPVCSLTPNVLLIVVSIIKDDHWSPSLSFNVTLSECTAPLCTHRIAARDRQKFFDPESVAIFDYLCDVLELIL